MKICSIIFLSAVLCGCVRNAHDGAYDGVSSVHPEASRALAANTAEHLTAAYPPGYTTLSVNTESDFGKALEGALRRKGFTLASSGLTVDYSVDLLRDEASPACYVRVSLQDGGSISQMYSIGKGMVVPAGNVVKAGLPDFTAPAPYVASTDSVAQTVSSSPLPDPATQNMDTASTPGEEKLPQSALLPAGAKSPLPNPDTAKPSAAVKSDGEQPVAVTAALQEIKQETGIPAVPYTGGWSISPGMLRGQLESWTSQAGYQLVWKARHDFEMQSQVIFRDDFVSAVQRLFGRMHLHGNPLRATIYQDNRVLEVVEE